MEKIIDLRSDTVTQPTEEMRIAMKEAEVGDDVYGDDPTINRLEALAAQMMGKEAALFVPSGTMGNQLSIMTHTTPGNEIIAGIQSHIIHYEGGAAARISGVGYALVDNPNTFIYAEDVRRLMRPADDPHFPRTKLLCLENALCDGNVVPLDILKASAQAAWDLGLAVHLDGARIFNAALALGTDAKNIAACADTVMFCVSKGLCAPVGSLLCGPRDFIHRARVNRKILGGGMRQAGVLAACGIVALEKMTKRLHEDHENARYLGEALNSIPGITADMDQIKINMVFWTPEIPGFAADSFIKFLASRGITVYGNLGTQYRFVTHNGIDKEVIDRVITVLREYIASL
ncbi:GntG family PLP-dependent aldolase [Breznakiella homolactica]|uniref:Aminotransferase class I/II-fold pyridoxal phosphate-dependent enzyme n=1 Tax=Breznakiella homolactica TaxID=2798577 RepID=A0A7T7XR03_9SPIR|nr:GntG family PLP-dependent aldolase [Breznakiella homolactica]QQO10886.1 aminotransferase class I/II-fold pyridoxal phosphate-dependent enzyme [Breznakiella homolactica]